MIRAEPEALGLFFAETGLEASPDEVQLWTEIDFFDFIIDFAAVPSDSLSMDSLVPLLEYLPMHLLEK